MLAAATYQIFVWGAQWKMDRLLHMLVSGGSLADVPPSEGENLLRIAAYQGRLETVKALFHAGVSADATDGEGWSAMKLAHLEGNQDVVDFLTSVRCGI